MLVHLLLIASQAVAQTPPAPVHDSAQSGYAPHRVYDSRHNRFTDFESMLADVMYADIVFLGEQHDDAVTHRLEAATLEGLTRRRGNIVLAMEMFERDAQPALDSYLAGSRSEADFLAIGRPWPRYKSDYRPMVEFAHLYKWPVIASNVPRRLASMVSRAGLSSVDTLGTADRAFVAKELNCPHDDYFDRFARTMGDMSGHGPPGAPKPSEADVKAQLERIYQAQCIKDETMGESIALAFKAAPPRALVLHVNGAFHSDYALGTAARTQSRLKGKRVAVVSFVPVTDLDTADGKANRKLGDYVVFTLAPKKATQ